MYVLSCLLTYMSPCLGLLLTFCHTEVHSGQHEWVSSLPSGGSDLRTVGKWNLNSLKLETGDLFDPPNVPINKDTLLMRALPPVPRVEILLRNYIIALWSYTSLGASISVTTVFRNTIWTATADLSYCQMRTCGTAPPSRTTSSKSRPTVCVYSIHVYSRLARRVHCHIGNTMLDTYIRMAH